MGLFDKIFGRGATKATGTDGQSRFNELRDKYRPALDTADQNRVQLSNLHLQENKLYFKGIAPSTEAKDTVWRKIKEIDPSYSDLVADIDVKQSTGGLASMASAAGGAVVANATQAATATRTYTVKAGDSLSKISREMYGDADEYMRIFYANRDKLNDPDMIHPGQELTIPPDDTP